MKKIKELLKFLNDNPRIKAIVKLTFWVLFFAVFFLIFYLVSLLTPSKPKKEDSNANIIKTIETIANGNYEFEYNITIMRFYKEENGSINKYQVEGEHAYQIIGDYFEPITDNIYGDIEPDYMNLDIIRILLSKYRYQKVDESYVFDMLDRNITVVNTKTNLKIVVNNESINYELLYYNFNNTAEIKRISD